MYNAKVECTYHTSEIFLEDDNITEEEKCFVRDVIYRQELLDILEINEYNELEFSRSIHELYITIKDCKELKECMLKLAEKFLSRDEEIGLMVLFAFDYMYLTHICISEFLENGKISENNIAKLKTVIF
jgi:hypothetical protein